MTGYKRVLQARAEGRLSNIRLVLPVVEFRIARFVGHAQWHRVNFHVIFSDDVHPDVIEREFLGRLNATVTINEGDTWSGPPDRVRLEDLGSRLRQAYSHSNPVSDLKLGIDSYNVEPDDVRNILSRSDALQGRYLTALGKMEWDQMAWNESSIGEKRSLINSVDFTFTASQTKSAFDASLRKLAANTVQTRLLHCSDAHHFSDSSESNRVGNCMTWVKAEPTFDGLLIARHEYEERVFVGQEPPSRLAARENPTRYIQRVRFTRATPGIVPWLHDASVELNPGLVAIIGHKGSGKSALTDALALVADADVETHLSFLSSTRFRHVRTGGAREFECTVTWRSGDTETRLLSDSVDQQKPERIRYLPQNYFEKLCSDVGEEAYAEFERELKRVVFSWLPEDRQLGKSSLDELIDVMTTEWRERRRLVSRELAELNREIARLERALQPTAIKELRERLAERRRQLEAHDGSRPTEPPIDDRTTESGDGDALSVIDAITAKLETLKETESKTLAMLAKLRLDERAAAAVQRRMSNIKYYIQQQLEDPDARDELGRLGISARDLVKVTLNEAVLAQKTSGIAAALASTLQEIERIRGEQHRLVTERDALVAQLDARRQEVRSQREAVQRWVTQRAELVGDSGSEGSLTWLEDQLQRVPDVSARLAELECRRESQFETLFAELMTLRRTYQTLFAPIEQYLASEPLLSEGLTMTVDAIIRNDGFAHQLLGHIDQSKRGSFFQGGEGPVRDLIARADFDDPASARDFARGVLDLLRPMDGNGRPKEDVDHQLRSRSSREQVYDLIFSLEYLSPHYALKLNDKEISQLSPGERGAALLIFFVLVDRSQIPIVLDQPEENLDNETVSTLLVPAIRQARRRRQVIIVTHNPNLAVYCDADQVVLAELERVPHARIRYKAGAIEEREVREWLVNVLEGTGRAFGKRHAKYSIGFGGELIFQN